MKLVLGTIGGVIAVLVAAIPLASSGDSETPVITEASTVAPKLTDRARQTLLEILKDAGLKAATVTSTERTSHVQAGVMIPQFEAALARSSSTVYGSIGKAVFERYKQVRSSGPVIAQAEVAKALDAQIDAVGEGRRELQHMRKARYFAFDVAPGSISDATAFRQAILSSKKVIRCIFPGQKSEKAFHLEVARDNETLADGKTCNDDFTNRRPASEDTEIIADE